MKLVSQTSVVPGQASTATVMGQDQNGNAEPVALTLPPGKAAPAPANMATTDDLKEFVSGTFAMGPKDLPAIGVHLNGYDDTIIAVLGTPQSPVYKGIPTITSLLGELKNGTGAIKHGIAQNCVHGNFIHFPQPFADDNVTVVITGTDCGPNHLQFPLVFPTPNRNGFQLSLNYWNGSGIVNETTPSTVYYIAIGNA